MKNTKGHRTAFKIAFLTRNVRAVMQLLRPSKPRYAAADTKMEMLFAALITILRAHFSCNDGTDSGEKMGQLLQSLSSLLSGNESHTATLMSLVIERLYYADGRHHPEHPNHGSLQGLTSLI